MWTSLQNNYHRVSFLPSDVMTEFKTIQMGNDIKGVIGRSPDGTLHLQSVLFPRSKFSVSEATIRGYYLERSYT